MRFPRFLAASATLCAVAFAAAQSVPVPYAAPSNSVQIPAAPAPTTGVILHLAPEDVRETKLTVGEALGLLMSFGSVVPKPESKE